MGREILVVKICLRIVWTGGSNGFRKSRKFRRKELFSSEHRLDIRLDYYLNCCLTFSLKLKNGLI